MPSPYEFTAPPGETLQIGAVDAPVVGVYLSGDIQDPDGNGASPSEIESAVTHAGTTGNPHSTTAANVGADASGTAAAAVASHESTYSHTDPTFTTARVGAGANYSSWDSTGHQTFAGNARPWRDALTDALNLRQTGTGVATSVTESVVEFLTSANLSDYIYANMQLNHDRDHASSIYPHIHWFQAENNIPNFLLEYRWQALNGAKATAWTRLKCNTRAFTYTAGTMHQICYSAAVAPPVGTTISDIVQWRIYRDSTNASTLFAGADPYTATVGVLAFDCHMQVNSLGSTDEYAK